MTREEIITLISEKFELLLKMFERDAWDYAAIIAPILLSVVAIVISIYSIYKQNKLNLFEKRYKSFCILSFLLSVANDIVNQERNEEKDILYFSRNTYLKIDSKCDTSNENDIECLSFYSQLYYEILTINCLYRSNKIKDINTFVELFYKYISNVFADEDTKRSKAKLKEIIILLEKKKSFEKLNKSLAIW